MVWDDVRLAHPNAWVILEVLDSHDEDGRVVPGRLTVLERCAEASMVMERYRALHHAHPGRFLAFGHTSRPHLTFEERYWAGVRLGSAA